MAFPSPIFFIRRSSSISIFLTLLLSCLVGRTFGQCGEFIQGDSLIVGCGDSVTLEAHSDSLNELLHADFNAYSIDSGFVSNSGPDIDTTCGTSLDNTPHAWFGPNASLPRSIRTVDADLTNAQEICFDFKFALENGSGSPCDGPDLTDEGVLLQYSTNGGGSWQDIFYFNPDTNGTGGGVNSPFTSWDTYCFSIPSGAQTSSARLRLYQPNASGSNFDHWGVDNIEVGLGDTSVVYDWGNGITTDRDSSFVPDDSSIVTADIIDTVANDTCTASAWVAYHSLEANIVPSNPNMCGQDSIQLQAMGLNGGYDHDWTPGTALSDSSAQVVKTGTDTPIVYSLAVQDTVHGFCYDTVSVQVDTGSKPDPSIQTDSVICGDEMESLFLANSYDSIVWDGFLTADTLTVDASMGSPTQQHEVMVTDSNGCMGSDTVQLTVDSANASVQVQNDTLWAANTSGSYQWVDCDSAYAPISGASSQSFYPSSNGNYAVVVSSSNCTDTSQCKSSLPNSIWNNQGSGVPGTLFAVHFTDTLHGWIATANGLILHTADGGNNWNVQMDTSLTLRSLHFADTNTGWTVGDSGTVLYTDDAGSNWTPQNAGTNEDLHSVHAATPNEAWSVGVNGISLHTSNAGTNWSTQNNGTSTDLNSVHFPDTDTGWSVGANGTILRTLDGGANWNSQTSGTNNDLNSTYFVNDTLGWVVGDTGTILRTQDVGVNWVDQLSSTNEDLESVFFVNDSTGWIVGATGTILYTTDGRSTWMPQLQSDVQGLKDIHVLPGTLGWAVGGNGTVLHYKENTGDPSSFRTAGKEEDPVVYPNPANEHLRIEHRSYEGPLTITLFDNLGKQLIERSVDKGVENTRLSLSELDAGIYFIRVRLRNGSQQTVQKIVVEE